MGDSDKRIPRYSQGRRRAQQAQGKYADTGRHSLNQGEAWHTRDSEQWSDELKQIIEIITGGIPIGKAYREE